MLTIDCGGSQSFDTGSYASFVAASETTGFDTATAGETQLVLTGAGTNSGVGAGSKVKLTYLGDDKILAECLCQPLGTGSNSAAAFAS